VSTGSSLAESRPQKNADLFLEGLRSGIGSPTRWQKQRSFRDFPDDEPRRMVAEILTLQIRRHGTERARAFTRVAGDIGAQGLFQRAQEVPERVGAIARAHQHHAWKVAVSKEIRI